MVSQHAEYPSDLFFFDVLLSKEEALAINEVLQEPLHNKKQLVRCKRKDLQLSNFVHRV